MVPYTSFISCIIKNSKGIILILSQYEKNEQKKISITVFT
jgi:hypothetical protein